jgi:hypothetical protein
MKKIIGISILQTIVCMHANADFYCTYACHIGEKYRDYLADKTEYYSTHLASREEYTTIFVMTTDILDIKKQNEIISFVNQDVAKNCLLNVKKHAHLVRFPENGDTAIIYATLPGYKGNSCDYVSRLTGQVETTKNWPGNPFKYFCSNQSIMPIEPTQEMRINYAINYKSNDVIIAPISIGKICVDKAVVVVRNYLEKREASEANKSQKK